MTDNHKPNGQEKTKQNPELQGMFLQNILMMSVCPYNQWQSVCLFKNYNGDCLITCLE
jgi:hypothetical protein